MATHGAGTSRLDADDHRATQPTHAAFAVDPAAVADQYLGLAAPVAITAGDKLSFWHRRGLERFDGGVVEVSTNGGSTWADIGAAAFTSTATTPRSARAARTRSVAAAFSGSSPYVQSVASLAAFAGQNILIRFRAGTDSSVSGAGWTVDDVHIGNEVSTTNHFAVTAPGFPTQTQDLTTQIVAPTARRSRGLRR